MKQPTLTIVIATFNAEKTLQKCIDSFVNQTYCNKQLIVIDGASTDNTRSIIKANQSHISFYLSEPDTGIYSAWNKALKYATGDWVCFLGADDYFYNERVLEEICASLSGLSPKIRVVYGRVMLIDALGEPIYPVGECWKKAGKIFNKLMSIPHPGTVHHRSLFADYGEFDESFKIAGDYEFLLRELKSAPAHFIPNLITVCMQVGGISSNPVNTIKQLKEVRRAQKNQGDYWPSFDWLMAYSRPCIRITLFKLIGEQSARRILDYFRSLSGKPAYWTKTR